MFDTRFNDLQLYMMNSSHLYKENFSGLLHLLQTNPTPVVVKRWFNKITLEEGDKKLIRDELSKLLDGAHDRRLDRDFTISQEVVSHLCHSIPQEFRSDYKFNLNNTNTHYVSIGGDNSSKFVHPDTFHSIALNVQIGHSASPPSKATPLEIASEMTREELEEDRKVVSYWFFWREDYSSKFKELSWYVTLPDRIFTIQDAEDKEIPYYMLEQEIGDVVIVPPGWLHRVCNVCKPGYVNLSFGYRVIHPIWWNRIDVTFARDREYEDSMYWPRKSSLMLLLNLLKSNDLYQDETYRSNVKYLFLSLNLWRKTLFINREVNAPWYLEVWKDNPFENSLVRQCYICYRELFGDYFRCEISANVCCPLCIIHRINSEDIIGMEVERSIPKKYMLEYDAAIHKCIDLWIAGGDAASAEMTNTAEMADQKVRFETNRALMQLINHEWGILEITDDRRSWLRNGLFRSTEWGIKSNTDDNRQALLNLLSSDYDAVMSYIQESKPKLEEIAQERKLSKNMSEAARQRSRRKMERRKERSPMVTSIHQKCRKCIRTKCLIFPIHQSRYDEYKEICGAKDITDLRLLKEYIKTKIIDLLLFIDNLGGVSKPMHQTYEDYCEVSKGVIVQVINIEEYNKAVETICSVLLTK